MDLSVQLQDDISPVFDQLWPSVESWLQSLIKFLGEVADLVGLSADWGGMGEGCHAASHRPMISQEYGILSVELPTRFETFGNALELGRMTEGRLYLLHSCR